MIGGSPRYLVPIGHNCGDLAPGSVRLDNEARDQDLYINGTAGSPNHCLGYVSGGTWASGDVATIRSVMTAPRRDGRVRLRVRFWTCDPRMPKRKPPK